MDSPAFHLTVDVLGKLETLLQEGVLHQVHEYVRLRVVWIEALILRGIVVLHRDNGILTTYDIPRQLDVVSVAIPGWQTGGRTSLSRCC